MYGSLLGISKVTKAETNNGRKNLSLGQETEFAFEIYWRAIILAPVNRFKI
jgi:hypothetical protein